MTVAARHDPASLDAYVQDLNDRLVDALQVAYDIAYTGRRANLRNTRLRTFDERGLHPYSVAWGRVFELEQLLGVVTCSPHELREAAERDALDAFVAEVKAA